MGRHKHNGYKEGIVEEEYDSIGPQDINDWIRWVKNTTDEVKKGTYKYKYIETYPNGEERDRVVYLVRDKKHKSKLSQLKKNENYSRFELVETTDGVTNKEDFVEACKGRSLIITDEEVFTKVYW